MRFHLCLILLTLAASTAVADSNARREETIASPAPTALDAPFLIVFGRRLLPEQRRQLTLIVTRAHREVDEELATKKRLSIEAREHIGTAARAEVRAFLNPRQFSQYQVMEQLILFYRRDRNSKPGSLRYEALHEVDQGADRLLDGW